MNSNGLLQIGFSPIAKYTWMPHQRRELLFGVEADENQAGQRPGHCLFANLIPCYFMDETDPDGDRVAVQRDNQGRIKTNKMLS